MIYPKVKINISILVAYDVIELKCYVQKIYFYLEYVIHSTALMTIRSLKNKSLSVSGTNNTDVFPKAPILDPFKH